MKKLLLFGLATVLFISCQQQPQRYFSESAEIDVVKALLSDYHAGNWDAWEGHYNDTAKVYHNKIKAATVKETRESLVNILSNVSSYKFDDESLFYEMIIDNRDEETWVNFWGNWKGQLAANDQKLVIPVHLTMQFVNGKIVEEYGYYDISEFTLALQAIEAAKSIELEEME